MPVPLRPFQRQLEVDIYAAWQQPSVTNVMPVAATGSGKTVLLSKVLYDYGGPSAAIAHRQELVSQISVALARNGVRHKVIGNETLVKNIVSLHIAEVDRSYYDPAARTAVCGVDTLIKQTPDAWHRSVGMIVQDEAHHVLRSNKWGKAAAMFPNASGLYPTATPIRADGRGLGRHADGLIDAMVLAPTMRQIIDMGYLTDYRIFAPPCSDLKLDGVEIGASGDFKQDQLRQAVHSSHITGDVVAHYLKISKGKLGVTFAVDVESAGEIAAAFRAAGVPAEVVCAETPDLVRSNILRRFKAREILQLVNVDLFGEGFDLPAIEVVSFARPTGSFALYCQQFGRALRLMLPADLLRRWDNFTDAERREHIARSEKPHAIIIDHVNNVLRHGLPDASREWSLDARDKRSAKKSDAIPLRVCLSCVQPYERVHKCCPYCGTYPEPTARSGPAFVDGDLTELDPLALAELRGAVDKVDGPCYVPQSADLMVRAAILKRHNERQSAQGRLRNAIAWWAGYQNARGRGDSESYRRFWYRFGVDVVSAQALGTREADELTARIARELDGIVDVSVDYRQYLATL